MSNLYDFLIEFIDGAGCEPVEGFEEYILPGNNLYLLEVRADGVVRQFGFVVLEREVAEPHVTQIGVPVTFQQFAAGVVALVPAGREDPLLEVSGVRTVEKHMLVVVRLDDEVVGGTDIRLHFVVVGPAVGDQHEPLTEVVDAVAQAVG